MKEEGRRKKTKKRDESDGGDSDLVVKVLGDSSRWIL